MMREVMERAGTVRILEMSTGRNETEGCTKTHAGLVTLGMPRPGFEALRPVRPAQGDGFLIPQGCAHKARCSRGVMTLMVA